MHLDLTEGGPVYGPFISRKQAQAQGLKWYFNGNPCKHGHLAMRQVANFGCRACQLEKNAANCRQWYQNKGRAQVIANSKQWAKDNPEKRKEAANKWARELNRDPVRNARKNKMRREGNRSALHKIRYQEDRNYRLMLGLKGRIQQALKLQCGRKAYKTAELLGCSIPEFKEWIASQFEDGMSWDNYGLHGWHIDHIRPCASFDLTDPEQQKQCFHYTNQQPLWAKDNMAKGAKWAA